jgi:hypothetical protein
MVVHNFDIIGISIAPPKTYSVLVIDPYAVLSLSVAFQSLQSQSWELQVIQRCSHIEELQPDAGGFFDTRKLLTEAPLQSRERLRDRCSYGQTVVPRLIDIRTVLSHFIVPIFTALPKIARPETEVDVRLISSNARRMRWYWHR